MYDLGTIKKINGLRPKYIHQPTDVFNSPSGCNETELTTKGYISVVDLLCDSSGVGEPNERALTRDQLIAKIAELKTEHRDIYTAITGEGLCQVYITVYTKNPVYQVGQDIVTKVAK